MALAEIEVTGVEAAFGTLLEEIEGLIDDLNRTGAQAFGRGSLEKASSILEQAKTLTDFHTRLGLMRKEWTSLYPARAEELKKEVSRRDLGRLQAGMRTREEEYVVPILAALSEMGGSAKMAQALDRVHELMKGVFKPVDEKPLASDPKSRRWRNAAQWARLTMMHEGLLKAESPRDVWEMTEAGRSRLRKRRSG